MLHCARAGASWILPLLALAACAPAERAPLDSLESLGGDETVIVGRVELMPPLRKGEQRVKGIVVGDVENRIFLIADERLRALPREPAVADYAGRIEAPLGSTFFVRSSSRPFYILGGVMFLDIGGSTMNRAYFPGAFQVAIKPGDRAVYVGTLRYHRDEFFEITRVTVADEYREANAEFTRRFGKRHSLRKALLAPAKQP